MWRACDEALCQGQASQKLAHAAPCSDNYIGAVGAGVLAAALKQNTGLQVRRGSCCFWLGALHSRMHSLHFAACFAVCFGHALCHAWCHAFSHALSYLQG